MYNDIFNKISDAKYNDLKKTLSKIREGAEVKIDNHALRNLLKSYDNINISIRELINKEIETHQINNVLSDFFNKICEYFEQKLSIDYDEQGLLALIKNSLQGSGLQGQSKFHQYISNRLLPRVDSADKLPEYLKKLSDYLMSLACDYKLKKIDFEQLGVKVNSYLGNSELQCLDGEIIRLEEIRGQDNIYVKVFEGLIDEFIALNQLPTDRRGLQIHMKELLRHILGQETRDTHYIDPAQYQNPNKIINFFNKFGVEFYEKLEEALIDEIIETYESRISQIIAEEKRIEKLYEKEEGEETEEESEERNKKIEEAKEEEKVKLKNTSHNAIMKKVQKYCPNKEAALNILTAIYEQDDAIIKSLQVTDAKEVRDTRSNAQEIIREAIDSTKEERIVNQFKDDPITQQEKYKSYLSINPFKKLDGSSISHEEVKGLVKLFQDDQQDGGQAAGDKLSKEEKRKLGLNLLRVLHTGSKDKYIFKMQFLSALWLIENMDPQSNKDDIDQFTQFTYIKSGSVYEDVSQFTKFTYFKSLFGYKENQEGNVTVSEEYEEHKDIIDLIINKSKIYKKQQGKDLHYLKYITQIEKGKITKDLAKVIFELGNLEGVQNIIDGNIEEGIDLGLLLIDGLLDAAEDGNSQLAQLLLGQKNINVNAFHEHGFTSLNLAVSRGHLKVVQEFLKHSDIDVKLDNENKNIPTPLYVAVSNGHLKIVQELLKHSNIDVYKSLTFAVNNGHLKIVQDLLKHIDVNKYLTLAVSKGHLKIVRELLKHSNIDVYSVDKDGYNILQLACKEGKEKIVKLIIDIIGKQSRDKLIAYINTPTNSGETPLVIAVKAGHVNIVKHLVENGAEVNQGDKECKITPLHWAVKRGRLQVTELLLQQKDIDVKATDKLGWTPLHIAAGNSHLNIVELLVKHKQIHLNATNKDGYTPLHLAAINGHLKVVDLLLSNGANINESFIISIINSQVRVNKEESLKMIKMAIDNITNSGGSDINLDKVMDIVLERAKYQDIQTQFIDELVRNGVNLNNAFLKAVDNKQRGSALILLEKGADPGYIDNHGNNALMIASGYDDTCNTERKTNVRGHYKVL